jgi:hypothetical protein
MTPGLSSEREVRERTLKSFEDTERISTLGGIRIDFT